MNQYPYPGAGGPRPPFPPQPPVPPDYGQPYSAPVPGQMPYPPGGYPPPYGGGPPPQYTYRGPAIKPPRKQADPPKKERRRRMVLFSSLAVICLCGGLWLALFFTGSRPQPPQPNQFEGEMPAITVTELPEQADDGLSTVEIVKKVSPSVVSLNVYMAGSLTPVSSGSGIIFSAQGYILTNAHVLADAFGVQVVLDDDRTFEAKIVGVDDRTDLAVVRIDATDLMAAEFGDATQLQLGERTVAIGNAMGNPGSVTQGIVSGLGRELQFWDGTSSVNLIQTDAAVNPGNSGGALLNRFGQVIGITSAKLASTEVEGMCFAIPVSEALPVVENLVAYGYVKDRAALGITVISLNTISGPANGLPSQGLYIENVEAYSDLPNHDIVPGDVIVKAGGRVMYETQDLTAVLRGCKPGDTLTLDIQKQGSGRLVSVQVLLVASPQ